MSAQTDVGFPGLQLLPKYINGRFNIASYNQHANLLDHLATSSFPATVTIEVDDVLHTYQITKDVLIAGHIQLPYVLTPQRTENPILQIRVFWNESDKRAYVNSFTKSGLPVDFTPPNPVFTGVIIPSPDSQGGKSRKKNKYTVSELKQKAAAKKIPQYYNMNKGQLMKALRI